MEEDDQNHAPFAKINPYEILEMSVPEK